MSLKEEFRIKSNELFETLKKIIEEGNVNHIIVRDDMGQKYLDVPVNVGVVGVVLAPFLATIATIAALAKHLTIEIERKK